MGFKLLLACSIVICLYIVSVQCQRIPRTRPTGRPRQSIGSSKTQASPTEAAKRKSASEANKQARRSQASNRALASAPVSGGQGPFLRKISTKNAGRFASAGSAAAYGGQTVVAGGKVYTLYNGRVWISGYWYVICGDYLMPVGYYICCADYPFPYSSSDPSECCGTEYYFPSREICCQGYFYSKTDPDFGLPTECCADTYYIPSIEVCCGGDFGPSNTYACCYNDIYLILGYCCTSFGVRPIGSPQCGTQCGGSVLPPSYVCCEGVPHAPQAGYQCCNTRYIYSGSSVCCGGRPYCKSYYTCCGDVEQLTGSEECCSPGVVAPIGQCGLSPGGGTHGYRRK